MNNQLKGNLAMGVSKTFSGLNQNALKYLVPHWMSPFSGVALRLMFGTAAFWITGAVRRRNATPTTLRQRTTLFLLGAVLMFGYMFTLLAGLKYTTPVTSSIFLSLQPVVVFIISAIFLHEKVTAMKVTGIAVGIAGALICILTQKTSAVASNPMLGAMFCMGSTICYSVYLVLSGKFLKKIDNVTVSKWTFLGGACSSVVAILFVGWDAEVLTQNLFSAPMLSLLFVLIFPTFLSYFLLDIGLRYLKTTVVALYANLILVVSAIASYILGQDIFSWWQILAIALIAASVYFVEVAEQRTPASAPATLQH